MNRKRNLEKKYISVLTLSDTDYPYSLYPVDTLHLLLHLQRRKH